MLLLGNKLTSYASFWPEADIIENMGGVFFIPYAYMRGIFYIFPTYEGHWNSYHPITWLPWNVLQVCKQACLFWLEEFLSNRASYIFIYCIVTKWSDKWTIIKIQELIYFSLQDLIDEKNAKLCIIAIKLFSILHYGRTKKQNNRILNVKRRNIVKMRSDILPHINTENLWCFQNFAEIPH